MKVVIIEDEHLMAADLANMIFKIDPDIRVDAILHSVEDCKEYFSRNTLPDLVFSDIQLGDGLSFEIFQSMSFEIPVIYCTAYDEYALRAFKANGIDYILKPFSANDVANAILKFNNLKTLLNNREGHEKAIELFKTRPNADTSVLVHIRDKILPVKLNEIAVFYLKAGLTYLVTFDGKSHSIQKPLDELEAITYNSFYRANRQHLVNRAAISDVVHYGHRKLLINLSISSDLKITISKVKASAFLEWLSNQQ